jgi:hypothetical protein
VRNEDLLKDVTGSARDGMLNTLQQMDLGAPVMLEPPKPEANKEAGQ